MSSHGWNKCKKLKLLRYKLLLKLPRPLLNCKRWVAKMNIDAQERATQARIEVEEMMQRQRMELKMLMETRREEFQKRLMQQKENLRRK